LAYVIVLHAEGMMESVVRPNGVDHPDTIGDHSKDPAASFKCGRRATVGEARGAASKDHKAGYAAHAEAFVFTVARTSVAFPATR
jgi:hypothetical protein